MTNQADCPACAARQFLVGDKGVCYMLDYALRDVVEVRRCSMCLRLFYAVPLSEWAEVVAGFSTYPKPQEGQKWRLPN